MQSGWNYRTARSGQSGDIGTAMLPESVLIEKKSIHQASLSLFSQNGVQSSVILFYVSVSLFKNFLVFNLVFDIQGAAESLLNFATPGNSRKIIWTHLWRSDCRRRSTIRTCHTFRRKRCTEKIRQDHKENMGKYIGNRYPADRKRPYHFRYNFGWCFGTTGYCPGCKRFGFPVAAQEDRECRLVFCYSTERQKFSGRVGFPK